MEFLYYLEGLRTPAGEAFFSVVTRLGEQLTVVGVVCLLYWCLDKRMGYRLAMSFFTAGLAVQTLKITFRVERPWVLDPGFTPVESALGEATGYSLPSGHTQSAATLGTVMTVEAAKSGRGKLYKIICALLCFLLIALVGLSRLYLGVHTPADVLSAFAAAVFFALLTEAMFKKLGDSVKYDLYISVGAALVTVGALIYGLTLYGRGTIEYRYAADVCKTSGISLAFAVWFYVERRFIRFSTEVGASSRGKTVLLQSAKFVVGLALTAGLHYGFKLLLPDATAFLVLRYFITGTWILAVYPLIFTRVFGKRTFPGR